MLLAAFSLALAGCGSGGDSSTPDTVDEETVNQISGVAELATYAYAAAGPEALYDYLAPAVTGNCSETEVGRALAGSDMPTGFRKIEDVVFEPERRARATVVQLFGDEERSVKWVFIRLDSGSWRLIEVPGLEECKD